MPVLKSFFSSGVTLLALSAPCANLAYAQSEVRSIFSGVYTQSQAEAGRVAYEAQCANCHGSRLQGTNQGMALAGEFFLIGWEGFTVGDLYDLNKETMPSSARGSLSTEDAEATLAYMLQANGYPAGDVPFTRSDRTLAEALIKLP